MIRKLQIFGTMAFTSLLLAPAAFGATEINVNPCNGNAGSNSNASGGFQTNLCSLDANNGGDLIRGIIVGALVIAALIALFFLIWGGIRWILSGGDKGKVEAARSMIIAAIVGLIITFLAYFILTLVLNLFGLSFNNIQLPSLTGAAAPAGTLR